ncbi:MAG: hypothetical protein PUE48_00740 [Eubacterium coprostanoligenes]|uniref:hypothetical protein n=1 Tax=Eubacterium coprostanoligenes TaxID=290054 RepID=UPI002409007C|nr:hypothetical protein [Eubacterium coprostanoligenes]MDD6664858.1 hypothetical protein [Eubacterium coprostanoligenes]
MKYITVDNVMQLEIKDQIHKIIFKHKKSLECLKSTKVLDAELAEKNREIEYYKMIKKLK